MTSLITATAWVPRGHAAAFPTKYVLDEDEYSRISKLAKLELEDASFKGMLIYSSYPKIGDA